jgi:hypothetical protein
VFSTTPVNGEASQRKRNQSMEEVGGEGARFSLAAAKLGRPENLLYIVFEKIWLGSGRSPHFFTHVLLY